MTKEDHALWATHDLDDDETCNLTAEQRKYMEENVPICSLRIYSLVNAMVTRRGSTRASTKPVFSASIPLTVLTLQLNRRTTNMVNFAESYTSCEVPR